jgi:hypothetical protein
MVWLEVVGWVGSALLVWSLLQTRILRLRALNLVGSAVLIVYNAVAGVWPMLGLNTTLALINIWQLRTLIKTRHDGATYEVVEVELGGELVQRLLERHREDIRRFNPDLALDGSAGGRTTFVVLCGDELVGAVLVRDSGGGVAQVELDYVTPKFRDITPGEFVFRRSDVLAERGFTKIVTPPGMVSPYYDQLGFEPEGRSYVLHLPVVDLGDVADNGSRRRGE